MRLILSCTMAMMLPVAMDNKARMSRIICQSPCNGARPSTRTRIAIAKAASLGALLMNKVTEVGAPW